MTTTVMTARQLQMIPLGDLICEAKPGFAVGERTQDGTIQVRMNNVDTEGNLDLANVIRVPATAKQMSDCSLAEGDVLFNNTNSTELVGKSTVFRGHDEPVTFSNHFTRLCVAPERLDPYYLARWLTCQQRHRVFEGLCTRWVGQSAVRSEKLLALRIPLPPLAEQKRITAILDKADAIRRKRHKTVDAAEEFLPSLFAQMFGRSGNKYRSEPLDAYLQFLTSGSRGWAEHYARSGKRFIRSLDVQMNRIGSDDVVFVDPPAGTEADRTRVQDGDVLMTITGSRIGRVAFVPDSFGEAYVSQHVAIARLLPSLRPRYCSMFLSLPDGGQRQIAKAQYGQTKPGLSLTNIRKFQIPIPPMTEQDRFIDSWTRFDDMAVRTRKGIREMDDLFNSLVQRAFRGEL